MNKNAYFIILVFPLFLAMCDNINTEKLEIKGFWKFSDEDGKGLNILYVSDESFKYHFSNFGYTDRKYTLHGDKLSLFYLDENLDTIYSAKDLDLIQYSNEKFTLKSKFHQDNYKRIEEGLAKELLKQREQLKKDFKRKEPLYIQPSKSQ